MQIDVRTHTHVQPNEMVMDHAHQWNKSNAYHIYHGIVQLRHATEAEVSQRRDRRKELHGDGREAHSETHKVPQGALGLQGSDNDIQMLLAHLVAKRQVQV